MRIVPDKPFLYKGGKRGVLLLHGFTGNTKDVRALGNYLNKHGYTCYAPLYAGHGTSPEELLTSRSAEWWQDVVDGYNYLKKLQIEEIAVVGLSLGALYALKLGSMLPVNGIVSMCAPIKKKSLETLSDHITRYAVNYKKMEKKSDQQIQNELTSIHKSSDTILLDVQHVIEDVNNRLPAIECPALIIQARQDHRANLESPDILYNKISSTKKSIKWYEQSSHIITRGPEKNQLHTDIHDFLEGT
ncbi:carboxylesterase [Virgibacillus phasianinus]|uniref:Carboxylesterase n=1 Tax=Virgibacillus phasianinus TaxID=2017483 RepID=A0A220TY54_9BACI|nr:alpha/beta fold hydrolase [Virgibacillus phasianinus]ASK60727.1 carboxylesterase [Virgibacillus phasianinus]